jgi:hypothetical protein
MERKEFLKRAGVGSVVLASFPAFAGPAWAHKNDDGRTGFVFQAASGQATTLPGGESIIMSGCGRFEGSKVQGGGEFVHFDGTHIPSPAFISTGSWKARRVLSFTEIGTFGVGVAGILELAITMRPCEGKQFAATLKIVCNIGPAGLVTSPFQQEGFTLTIPGVTPFAPFTPNIGLTFFTRDCGDEEDDD